MAFVIYVLQAAESRKPSESAEISLKCRMHENCVVGVRVTQPEMKHKKLSIAALGQLWQETLEG